MTARVALAALLGGLVLFCWGFVSHTVLQLGDAGLRSVPLAPADQPLLDTLSATLPEPGLYFFPGFDQSRHGDEAAMEEWTERTRTNPHGMIVYNVGTYEGMSRQLVGELVTDVAVALLAALLLSWTLGCRGSYVGRVGFVALLGLLVAFRPIQKWNWFELPTTYTAAQVLDGVLGFLAMGLVLAAIVKPRPPGEGAGG